MLLKQIVRDLLEVGYALAVTFGIGKWAFRYAYLERGYDAVGGEFVLVLIAFCVAYRVIHFFFDVLEEMAYERSRKKRRSRKAAGI